MLLNWDHFFSMYDSGDSEHYECWTTLAAWAEATSRLTRIRRRWDLLNPLPTRSIPILIGGNGVQRTLRLAAEHADIRHGFGTPTDLAEKHRILDAWCAEVQRDSAEIERSTRVFRGTPEEIGTSLVDVGITLFTLVAQGPVFDPTPVRDRLDFRDDINRSRIAMTGAGHV